MQKLQLRVGVGALASPLEVGADRAAAISAALAGRLRAAGCEVLPSPVPVNSADAAARAGRCFAEQHVEALCLGAASWFEDYLVLDLLEECDVPLLLWPQPGMETGALCGAQQLTCYLSQLGRPFRSVFGAIEDEAAFGRALSFLRAASLKAVLRRARIGLAGMRVPGMTEVSANEIALKRTLGPRVVGLDLPRLLARAAESGGDEAARLWAGVKGAAARVEAPEEEGITAARMVLALRETAREEGLSAIAFGCYPDQMGRACLAASRLADEGLPIACEGDVNGAVGMLMLSLLTGQPTHNTDWLEPLPDGAVVFTHCGSGSHSLAARPEEIVLAPVRLTFQGVCSLFPARPGPVTLISLVPRGAGYQMAVMEGEALPTEMVFPGNPLRVRFERPVSEIIDWVHEEGIGHHWMAGYGRVGRELRDLAGIIGGDLRAITI